MVWIKLLMPLRLSACVPESSITDFSKLAPFEGLPVAAQGFPLLSSQMSQSAQHDAILRGGHQSTNIEITQGCGSGQSFTINEAGMTCGASGSLMFSAQGGHILGIFSNFEFITVGNRAFPGALRIVWLLVDCAPVDWST